jgi:hypothetical protein
MPVINGVYTKDFPALGRAPIDTDIIPIAEVANQITFKTTIGEIFNAKVFGTAGAIPKFTSGNTLGDSIITELTDKIGVDIATPNNKLSINSTDPGSGLDLQIGATSYARFGIINPGLPGEPGVDNDCFIGSTINNDFLVRTNNIEALRIDTAQRLTIANIQNALADTDKFLVSEGGVIKYRTGAEVLADIGAGVGSVTSVGLTMPVAFSVANSPITSAGTLEVTAIGSASQYIRGDGTLATIPSTSSGGANVNYYLNGSVAASVATYKQMDNSAVIGAGTDFNLTGNGLIAQFLTDAGNPNRLLIPGGAWNFEMYFNISSSGGNSKFYVELLKYDGTTFTSIASSVAVPEEITGGTTTDLYITSLAVPESTLLITDRLALRVYIVDNSGGRTVTLHTEDNTLCLVTTTFAGGIAALNGLTSNTQYFATGTTGTDFNISSLLDTHTFNLPTASATNRGALSSSNWSTFNGKIGGTGTANYIPKFNGTSSLTNSTIFEDAGGVAIGVPFTEAGFLLYVNGGIKANGNSTINGNLTASQFIVPSGTSSQFLKADGSVDTTTYQAAISLAAIGITPNANGASLVGSLLNLQPADASFGGVVTTGTQTFAGDKTFSSDLTVNGVNIGLGGGSIDTNTRVGSSALGVNTTGFYNSAFGYYALSSNIIGKSNSAFGLSSLRNNLADNNTAIGAYSGNQIISGDNNTLSSNSVYLGYDTRPSANGNTNEIVIGYAASGGGSNSATLGNTSIATTILHGNTSIGYTTNPSLYKLDVNGTGRFAASAGTYAGGSLILTSSAGTNPIYLTSNGGYFALSNGGGGDHLLIASTGAATFSSSVSATSFNLGNGQFLRLTRASGALQYDALGIVAGTDNTRLISTGDFDIVNGSLTSQFKVAASGNVGIGTTSPAYQLQLSTDSAAKPTSALWTIASDERIKENITPYTKGLTDLLKINPVNYDYNGLGGFKKGKGGVGIIAQEIINILPDSVSSIKAKLNEDDKDEIDILNFNGHELTYVLINAIKELKAEIELLKNK